MTPEEKARMMAEMEALNPGPPPAMDPMAAPDAYVQQPGQAEWQVARDAGIARKKRGLEEIAMDREIHQNNEAAARESMNRGFLAPGSEHLQAGEYGGPPAAAGGGDSSFEDKANRFSKMMGDFSRSTAPQHGNYVSSPGEVKKNIRPADNSRVYEALSNSDYEYKDPQAPGAGEGTYNGPMAEELSAIPGVVQPGPDGFDRVDTNRLTMANASETGKLRREMDALRAEITALNGDPDAVLGAVNKPGPTRQAQAGDVDFGDIAVEADKDLGGEWSDLESAGRSEQELMRHEMRGRRQQASIDQLRELREQNPGVLEQFASKGPEYKSSVSPYDTEPNRNPRVNTPQSNTEQAGMLRDRYAEKALGERPPEDFDARNRVDVLAQANFPGVYGKGEQRAAAVEDWLAAQGVESVWSPESAAQMARQMNFDEKSGKVIGNIQPGEILEILKRRTETAL